MPLVTDSRRRVGGWAIPYCVVAIQVSLGSWDGAQHNLTLHLDSNQRVAEAYEDNNIIPIFFSFCQWAPPPPPPPPTPPPSPPPPPPPPVPSPPPLPPTPPPSPPSPPPLPSPPPSPPSPPPLPPSPPLPISPPLPPPPDRITYTCWDADDLGMGYRGDATLTVNGYNCQNWTLPPVFGKPPSPVPPALTCPGFAPPLVISPGAERRRCTHKSHDSSDARMFAGLLSLRPRQPVLHPLSAPA
jgi:hypothetical protein